MDYQAGIMNKAYINYLVVIIIIGSILRFYGLNHESLWNDELSSCYRSSFDSIKQVVDIGVIPDKHPPAYQILLFLVERTCGDSALALRIPSVIAGIFTLFFVFFIGKRMFSESIGLLATAMLAVSPVHIWYSQEARAYSILILLTSASVYILIRILENLIKDKPAGKINTVGFITIGLFMEYIHYFGLLMIILEAAVLIIVSIRQKHGIRISILICSAFVIAYLPWIPIASSQSGSENYITNTGLRSLLNLLFEYMSWSKILMAVFGACVLTALSIYLLGEEKKTAFSRMAITVLGLWLILPVIISLTISYLFVPVFTNRNLLIILPAVFILFSVSIHIVFNKRWPRIIASTALCVFFLFQLFIVREHYSIPHKNQFRETAEFAALNYSVQKETVIVVSAWNEFYFNYYFERNPGNLTVDAVATSAVDFSEIRDLIELQQPEELWFLWGHLEPDEALIDSVAKYFTDTEYVQFTGAGVWHFSSLMISL